MKKFLKFCALAGLILVLAGSGITAGASLLGGQYPRFGGRHMPGFWRGLVHWIDRWDGVFDWDDWDDLDDWDDWDDWDVFADWDENQTLLPALAAQDLSSVRKLDLDISKGTLKVYKSEGISQIQVNVEDIYNKTVCSVENNTLKIKQGSYRHKSYSPKIEIQVPSGFHFDQVSLDTGTGSCRLDGISTSRLDMDTGVGTIFFAGTVTGDIDLDTGVGDVTLELAGLETDYNYAIDCGVGTIRIGNTRYSFLSRSTAVDHQASRNMNLDCGVGSVTITFIDTF